MKSLFTLLLILIALKSSAQDNIDKLYNTWVVSKITFVDGSQLQEDNLLKYVYLKYSFRRPDKANLTNTFSDKGDDRFFELSNGYLRIKSEQGGLLNMLKVERLSDTLILVQHGRQGFDDPSGIKYYFVPETVYQNSISLKNKDIHSIISGDTTFEESPKIYASFKDASFQRRMYNGISDRISMDGRSGHFLAVFTVYKSGIPDSLKIIEGIDKEFDERFIKVFNQAKKDWHPAILNGKPVNVQMKIELRYSMSGGVISAYFASQKAVDAYNAKQYDIALYYYDEALKETPNDKEFLYRRGMCKMLLGNKAGACEDWNKAKDLGSTTTIDAVLEKYCK
jgi:hypothetical protein